MPPVAIAVAAVAVEVGTTAALSGAVIAGVTIGATAAGILGAVAAMAVSLVGGALLSGGSKSSGASTATTSGVPRTITVRQAVSPRAIVIGQQRVGGVVTFLGLSDFNKPGDNRIFHVVITIASHRVKKIGAMYINGVQAADESGVGIGKYAGLLSCFHKLGSPGEPIFSALVAANIGWTAQHLQEGCAAIYVALTFEPTAFSGFDISQISVDVMGLDAIYDPRTGTTGFTDNAALVVAWYLTDPLGLGAPMSTDVDIDDLIAAANACDEYIDIVPTEVAAFTADPGSQLITINEPMQPSGGGLPSGLWAPLLGDKVAVTVTGGGVLPASLSDAIFYYWIPFGYIAGSIELGTPDIFTGQLATSLANALAGIGVGISDAGTATLILVRVAERRYCANGSFTLDQPPSAILPALLSAMGGTAGKAIWTGGQWSILAGVYRSPDAGVPALSESDFRKDGFTVQSLASHRDYCNGVRGKFINPAANWQEDDYPPAQDDSVVTDDGGEAWTSLNLPMELSPTRAQRIAWMELRRARLEMQIPQLPAKLTALRLRTGDTAQLSYSRFGWVNRAFEVIALNLVRDSDLNQMPVLGVDLALRLTDPSAYAWDPTQAQHVPIAPKSNVPDPSSVIAPGVPVVQASLYPTVDGQSLKQQAAVTWSFNGEPFLAGTHLEWSLAGAEAWNARGAVRPVAGATVTDTILDVAPGSYDFRVQNENFSGALSAFTYLRNVVIDLPSIAPSAPTNFTVTTLSGFAVLRYDSSPDLSVRIGGYGRVRFTPASLGSAAWQNGFDLGPKIPALSTQETLELGAGTYMFKWVNFDGIESASAAMFEVDAAASLTTLANSITVTESPTFPGAKTDCAVSSGFLKLVGAALIDAQPDWDAISDIDELGGIVSDGSYAFSSGIDLGSVKPVRLTASLAVFIVNDFDQFDARGAAVDDWDDWDGATAASGTAKLYERHTSDDPGVSPTWTAWAPVLLGDYKCRAFQFDLDMNSFDPAYNVAINALAVTASYN